MLDSVCAGRMLAGQLMYWAAQILRNACAVQRMGCAAYVLCSVRAWQQMSCAAYVLGSIQAELCACWTAYVLDTCLLGSSGCTMYVLGLGCTEQCLYRAASALASACALQRMPCAAYALGRTAGAYRATCVFCNILAGQHVC